MSERRNFRKRWLNHYSDSKATKAEKRQAKYDNSILNLMAHEGNELTSRGIQAALHQKGTTLHTTKVTMRLEHLQRKGVVETNGIAPGCRYYEETDIPKVPYWRLV